MKLRTFGWLYVLCLLPVTMFLAACDDDGGGGTQVVVVTNVVDGQTIVVTNTITPPEPENLYNSTLSVADGATAQTDDVTAPDDGTITAVADWNGGGGLHVRLLRNGVPQTGAHQESPITMTAATDDGINWAVWIENVDSPGAKNVHVTIGYLPEE
jgi:hypothetical protein